jgi:NDP-sugar pyrophosphorylase family protein
LADAGIRRVVLCTGYMGERVHDALGNAYRNVRLLYSREPWPLGTGGSLRLALPLLKSDPVLVINGDSMCEASLAEFFRRHRACGAKMTLLLAKVSDAGRFGRVSVDSAGLVQGFVEKDGNPGPGLINAGVYLIERRMLRSIPTGRAVSLERDLLPRWIGRGLYGYPSDGPFLDIGTRDGFAAAGRFLASRAG